MNHDKIIASFASTEVCCGVQHCIHRKGIACNASDEEIDDDSDDFNTRFCLNCISGIFHTSLLETEKLKQEKREKISEGHQFIATGFTDGDLYQYEYINTGERFFYQQAPDDEAIVQETGLKWLKQQGEQAQQPSLLGPHGGRAPRTTSLCVKGSEFNEIGPTDKKQKTLDDYVTKKTK